MLGPNKEIKLGGFGIALDVIEYEKKYLIVTDDNENYLSP